MLGIKQPQGTCQHLLQHLSGAVLQTLASLTNILGVGTWDLKFKFLCVHWQAMASALPSGMATPVEASRANSLGGYLKLEDLHGPGNPAGQGPRANFSSSGDQPEHLFGSEAPHMGAPMGIPSFSNRPPSHLGPSRVPPELEPAQRLPESAAFPPVFG